MKKSIFILLLAITFFSCSPEDDSNPQENITEATLLGRWNLVGFEQSVLYEFTSDKRYTMYSTNGGFESLENAIESGQFGHDYWYDGQNVTIDLNFGNVVTLTPQFTCDNSVVNWKTEEGETHSSMFREGFDFTLCNE